MSSLRSKRLQSSAFVTLRSLVAALFGALALTAPLATIAATAAPAGSARRAIPAWVLAKPAPVTQSQKTSAERGVNPCNTADPGFGIYDAWSRAPTLGQMIMPQRGGVNARGEFDLMVHFHGHEAARKEWVRAMDGAVFVAIDLGTGSGPYDTAFQDPAAFEQLVRSVEVAVAKKTGRRQTRARKIGLSAWSAGYGAVLRILDQPFGKGQVDAVVLLDGLHCGYAPEGLSTIQLGPVIRFGQLAARGAKFLFVSHSSIIPPGYASTTETANFLVWQLGGQPVATRRRNDPMGLELIASYSRGGFHMRGFAGNDKMDHCAHLGLYRDVLRVHIKPRWNSPRGFAASTR